LQTADWLWRKWALNGSFWRLFAWQHRLRCWRTVHFNGFLLLAHHLEQAFEAIDRVAEIALAGGAAFLEHRIPVVFVCSILRSMGWVPKWSETFAVLLA
jgi:hypothetical protein